MEPEGIDPKLCSSQDSSSLEKRAPSSLRPQSMENLLLRVQANVAKEFEVEKDVAPRR